LQDKRGIFKKSILQKNPLVKENLNQGENFFYAIKLRGKNYLLLIAA
jgi:hypothetical protein